MTILRPIIVTVLCFENDTFIVKSTLVSHAKAIFPEQVAAAKNAINVLELNELESPRDLKAAKVNDVGPFRR